MQSAPEYTRRLDAVRQSLMEQNLDGFLVLGSANRRYLTGYTARDTGIGESAGMVVVTLETAYLVVNPLYIEHARQESQAAEPVELGRGKLAELFAEKLKEWRIPRLGFERNYMLYGFYEDLKEALGGTTELVPVQDIVEKLRVTKDAEEQRLMQEAARIADDAYIRVTEQLRPGMTEAEVARALHEAMIELGADGLAFETIVAAGENSARPHHEPTSRQIQVGEPITIDMGARYQGYCSDMTRSFCLDHASDQFKELYDLVLRAHNAAKAAVKPGAIGKDVDQAARDVLEQAGHGEHFTHGLGHGVGLDVHEQPGLGKLSETALEPGMVVTIEPGVYLSGWGGIRIEDTVVVTEDGYEVLNQSPKTEVI